MRFCHRRRFQHSSIPASWGTFNSAGPAVNCILADSCSAGASAERKYSTTYDSYLLPCLLPASRIETPRWSDSLPWPKRTRCRLKSADLLLRPKMPLRSWSPRDWWRVPAVGVASKFQSVLVCGREAVRFRGGTVGRDHLGL